MKRILLLLILLLAAASALDAQTYQLILKNDTLVSDRAYEFDVFILQTGATTVELATYQIALTFNPAITGGSLSFTYDNKSCQLQAEQLPSGLSVNGNVLQIPAGTPPGHGNGTILTADPGLRIGRFRITSTTPFVNLPANIAWKNSGAGLATQIAYYDSVGNFIDITDSTQHLNQLQNPALDPLAILSAATLPAGTNTVPYADTLTAEGGTPPYSWSQVSGSLPAGITLSSSGVVSGTTTSTGPFSFTAQVNDAAGDSVSRAFSLTINPDVYTITATAGANGTVAPNGSVPVTYGTGQGFVFTPSAHYHVDTVLIDGVRNTDSLAGYTFTNVTANHTVRVTFRIDQNTILPTAGANGSISPSAPVQVNYGSNQKFTFTPSTGYHLDSLIVDGARNTDSTTSYTFVNVTAPHTIRVTFAINQFTILPTAGANGSISPSAPVQVNYGSNQQFTITPDGGYHLDSLIVDGVRNTDSTASYTFLNVTAAHTIRVTFAANQFTILPTAGPNGSISPSGPVQVTNGSNQRFTFSPNTGYHLDSLIVDGARNTDSTTGYTFVNVTAAHTIRVTFAIDQYTILPTAGANGSISPSAPVQVNYGSNQQFTFSPNSGYHVDSLIVDGARNTDSTSSYTFVNVTAAHTIRVTFAITQYTILPTAGANGAISPSSPVQVNSGSNQQFTFSPNTGYHLDSLIVDGARNTDSTSSYTFVNVTAAHTIRVTFAINQYTILPTAGANGSISPSTPTQVNYGSNQKFTITPNSGYHVDSLIVDGARNTDSTTSYTFVNVTTAHTIRVTFAINQYTILPTAGPNGSITPSGPTQVSYGSNQQFTFGANTGYHLDSLIVDGTRNTDSASSYTFVNVTAAHTIRVTFAINQYTILPTAGANGSISPSTPTQVNYGSNQKFTFTPNTGYHLDSLIVDGARNTDSTTSYTFVNVTTAHTIRVTFAINQYTITPSAGPNGSISPPTPVVVNYGGSQLFTFTPNTGYHVDSVYADGVYNGSSPSYLFPSVTQNHTISVTFAINRDTVIATSGANGAVIPGGMSIYNYGTSPVFSIRPNTGYHVDSLIVDGVKITSDTTYTFSAISTNHTIRGTFAPNTLTILVTSAPTGQTVKVNGTPHTAPYSFSSTAAVPITIAVDSIQGDTAVRVLYRSWNDGGAISHTIVPLVNTNDTAVFQQQYYLKMAANAGGTSTPASGWHNAGDTVTITGTPSSSRYNFSSWSGITYGTHGGSSYYSGPANPYLLTMNAAVSEIANFVRAPFQIVTETTPPGRSFTFDGTTYTNPYTYTVGNPPELIYLNIPFNPQPGSAGVQYAWTGWNDGGGMFHTAVADSAFTYIASFKTQFNLNVVAGSGGTATPPAGYVDSGSVNPLLATPNTGYSFVRWAGTGTGSYSGTTPNPSVTAGGPINDTAYFAIDTLTISATAGSNGTISPSGNVKVLYGANQTFHITPSGAYHISDVVVDGSSVGPDTVYTFTGVTTNHTITASFTINGYTITATAGPNGTISPSGPVSVNSGASQTFSIHGNTGYFVDSILVDNVSKPPDTTYTFTNVTANHTIRTVFAPGTLSITLQTNPSGLSVIVDTTHYTTPHVFNWLAGSLHTLSLDTLQNGTPGVRYSYSTWSDTTAYIHTVAPLVNTTYTASFATQYQLTLKSGTGGSAATVPPGGVWFASGSSDTIRATPSTGYVFSAWTGTGTGSYTGAANPAVVVMSAPVTDSASFALKQLNVTIQSNPPGRSVIVDGTTYTAPHTFNNWNYGQAHTLNTTTPQAFSASVQYAFKTWSDSGTMSHSVSPVSDTTFTANFLPQFLLTTAAGTGGTVNPASAFYDSASQVNLTAVPSYGYQFTAWTGTGTGSYTGSANPAQVTMTGPLKDSASFGRFTAHVTVRTTPPGLFMTVDDTVYTSPRTFSWTTGSSHKVTLPDTQAGAAGTRYVWNSWSDGGTKQHNVTPLSDTTFTAALTTQFLLTMNSNTGGTSTPPTGWYDSSKHVTITAIPGPKYNFFSWAGTGTGAVNSANATDSVTMGSPISETPNFIRKPITITVQALPPGRSFILNGVSFNTPQIKVISPGDALFLNVNQTQPDPVTPLQKQYVWTSWSDGGAFFHTVYPDTDMTLTAYFKTQFMTTIAAGPGGSVLPASGWQDSSAVDTLIATPNAGYALQQWIGSGPGSYSGVANNVPITIAGPISDSAVFSHFPVHVTVQSSPAGRPTIVDGVVDSSAVRSFTWTASSSHTIGIADSQYSGPGTRYFWVSWSDGGAKTHTVVPLKDTSFTVTFQPQYMLTMNAGSGGTVAPPSGWYNGGQQVVITATPNATYNFGAWNGTGTGSYTGSKNPDTIAVNGPITETASFALTPVHITVQTVPSGLSVSVDSVIYTSPQNFVWDLGAQHVIRAMTPQNVTATSRTSWKSWSDTGAVSHTVAPTRDSVFTAIFATQFLLTEAADTGGTVTPGSGWQDSGSTVQLTAHAGAGYAFTNWRGSGSGSYSGPVNPASVTMKGAVYDTAGFSRFQANVTIVTNPPGLHIMVNGGTFPTPYNSQWTTGAIHTITAIDSQAGTAGTRYVYASWSDSGARIHDVVAIRDTTFTANFTTQYFLTDSANTGGTVMPVSGWYNSGKSVTITAIPNNKYTFQRWTGTGTGSYTGSTNPVAVTISSPTTEIASFNQNPFIVNVNTNPAGRSFIYGGTTYTTPQTFIETPGTLVYLDAPTPQPAGFGMQYAWKSWSDSGAKSHTASIMSDTTFTVSFTLQYALTTTVSPANSGTTNPPSGTYFNAGDTAYVSATGNAHYAFLNWTGDATGTANPIKVAMTAPKNLNANFGAGLQVTIAADSVGRSVLIDDSVCTTPVVLYWLAASPHTLGVPSPQNGATGVRYVWKQWSDSGAITHSVSTTRDTVFTARFQTQYFLTMGGNTGGTVAPASSWYPKDTSVAISATPDSGYALITWNGSGAGSYSGILNPATVVMSRPMGETAQFGKVLSPPTLLAVDSNSVNVSTTPLLKWHAYPGATSYRLQVAFDSLFSSLAVDASPLTDTTYQVPALGNLLKFFWRVNAIVGPDITKFSPVWTFTTLTATISAASPIENWGTTYTYPVTWSSSQLSGNVNIRLSTDNGASWRMIRSSIPNSGSAFWTVPDTQHLSGTCKYRVESTLNPAIYSESVIFAIVSGVLPPTVHLSTSIVYPAAPATTDYRLVSLPGDVDTITLGSELTGSQKLDWRAYSDNGLPTNYLTELDKNYHFTAGNGIWLVKKGNLNLTGYIMTMPAIDTILARLAIPLHTGWNIIGNPFDKDVAWADVLALNGLPPTTQLTMYTGSYGSSSTLSAFNGYYFLNDSDLTTLEIPYPFGSVLQPHGKPATQWTLQLSLRTGTNSDPENYVGIAPTVMKGMNALTYHKPPFFMDQAFLYFRHPEWDPKRPWFSSDFRPELGDGQTWDFEVRNPSSGTASIRTSDVNSLPDGIGAVLINMDNSEPYDLKLHPVYSYATVSSVMQFRLIVGTQAYITREVGKLKPQSYELEQNFPNPFNPTTSIGFKLPKASSIRLEVYSILGQKVRTIAEGNFQPGVYTYLWDGTDERNSRVASGVYFYRLMADGGMVQTKKMILAK